MLPSFGPQDDLNILLRHDAPRTPEIYHVFIFSRNVADTKKGWQSGAISTLKSFKVNKNFKFLNWKVMQRQEEYRSCIAHQRTWRQDNCILYEIAVSQNLKLAFYCLQSRVKITKMWKILGVSRVKYICVARNFMHQTCFSSRGYAHSIYSANVSTVCCRSTWNAFLRHLKMHFNRYRLHFRKLEHSLRGGISWTVMSFLYSE